MNLIYDYNYVFKNNNNDNESIIFVHGYNSSPRTFEIFEKYWTRSNYYALQFPGSNLVKAVKDHKVSVEGFAQLLIDFIEQNQIKNLVAIGHSMGGGVISIAYKMRPDLFKKLIFITPMNKPQRALYEQYKIDYFPKTFDEYINNTLPSLYYDPSILTSNQEWMKQAKQEFDPYVYNNDVIVELGEPKDRTFELIEQGLDAIKIPSLLILGEKDGVILRDECLKYFDQHVKGVEMHWMKKTGHMVFQENFHEFIKIVENFLNKTN
ncbi:alpha/beta fold hydrolase [Mycoplasma mycoides]|uniref:alpha/beta fold hydrolase n=1 Tax=Mycoplasma mycoides TaxID=2102 RepID=UPI00223F4710|nr:alpha/beta hydrolase [Mycoplasma mycoides]QVK09708.1 alpha/beta hydrolase [Mycoplasma mycoides subsp. capri]